jgi:hypothetical protein
MLGRVVLLWVNEKVRLVHQGAAEAEISNLL